MFANDTALYFTGEDRRIQKLRAPGQTPETIFESAEGIILSINGNENGIFFFTATPDAGLTLHSVSEDTSEHHVLGRDLANSARFVVDEENIYIVNSDLAGDFSLWPIDAGQRMSRSIESTIISDVALDATHLYWSTSDGALKRLALPDGEPELLTQGHERLRALRLDAAEIFAISESGVLKVPKSGGCARALVLPMWGLDLQGLFVDEGSVYFGTVWQSDLQYSAISRTPRDGGVAVSISPSNFDTGSGPPTRLTKFAGHLYWPASGGINSLRIQ